MEDCTVEGPMHISEPVTIRGVVTLTLFDHDGNEVVQQRHNLVTDAMKQRILGPLAGVSQSLLDSTLITRFAFGTSGDTPVGSNTKLGREVFRKPVTLSTISGNHFIADCNIGFSELNTVTTTATGTVSATSITVASATGFRAGDTVEVNSVSTIGVTTDAQFVTISSITGNTLMLTSPGLVMTGAAVPAAGWFVMQIIREAGTVMSVNSAIIQQPITLSSFGVSNPSLFSVGQCVNVPTGLTTAAIGEVQSVVGSVVTLTSALPALPVEGYVVENGVLANHATGFAFRKASNLTAIARVDFSMD